METKKELLNKVKHEIEIIYLKGMKQLISQFKNEINYLKKLKHEQKELFYPLIDCANLKYIKNKIEYNGDEFGNFLASLKKYCPYKSIHKYALNKYVNEYTQLYKEYRELKSSF